MEEKAKEICAAAETGDATRVKGLLQLGVNVNSRHPENGRTALFYAAEQDHQQVIKALLKAGADVNLQENNDGIDFKGETAIFLAGHSGNDWPMRELLKTGKVDVNIVNTEGSTAADFTPSLELKRKMVVEHGLVKPSKSHKYSEDNDDCVSHHCLWMTTYEGEPLLEPSTKRVKKSQLVIDVIDLHSKSLVRLIEACFQSGFFCEQIDRSYYDRLFIGTQLTQPKLAEMLLGMRTAPSSINVGAIMQDVKELHDGEELEEAERLYKDLIGKLFPMKLQSICRLAILSRLPTGYKRRREAIDAIGQKLLPRQLCDFLKFE